MQIALKIDADTLRGTRAGVPALVSALQQVRAGATFLFSLGPDHTGRAIRRVFRKGFMGKVSRTSVLEHYGLRTLLYGTLLPGPDIAARAGDEMRAARDAGFEVGIHCYDHVAWQDFVAHRDADWTARQMQLAASAFETVFATPARTHGAAGWQMNDAALALEERFEFAYASDTRGAAPFVPLIMGRRGRVPQLPTTLPTLDELIGIDGITADNVHETLLAQTRSTEATSHVFTLHAELEGMKLLPVLKRLLAGWLSQGHELVSLATLCGTLDVDALPACAVIEGTVPGRSGTLACQQA
ncbi:MAG: 4-deoxy-4-formamido-L-arabinose-phosphoundecaprenol deformylase [Steroidobacteraceae bacterium]